MSIVGYWNFLGSNADDKSGNGKNGTLYVGSYVTGGFGTCVNLPDTNMARVSIGSAVLSSTTEYTVVVYYNPTFFSSTHAQPVLFNNNTASWNEQYRMCLERYSDSIAYMRTRIFGTNGTNWSSFRVRIYTGKWYVGIYTVKYAGTISHYLEGYYSSSSTSYNTALNTNPTHFGCCYTASTTYERYNGKIGLVIAYNKQLGIADQVNIYSHLKGFF